LRIVFRPARIRFEKRTWERLGNFFVQRVGNETFPVILSLPKRMFLGRVNTKELYVYVFSKRVDYGFLFCTVILYTTFLNR